MRSGALAAALAAAFLLAPASAGAEESADGLSVLTDLLGGPVDQENLAGERAKARANGTWNRKALEASGQDAEPAVPAPQTTAAVSPAPSAEPSMPTPAASEPADEEIEVAEISRQNGTWNQPVKNAAGEPARRTSPAAGSPSLFDSIFAPSTGSVSSQYSRQSVRYTGKEKPGTIVIDTTSRYLFHVMDGGIATRYGVGVGRQGFLWKGNAVIGDKREWPTWTPPPEMRKREPWLPVSMPGGPENPLGARALYLYKGGKDTLYRIHGTNQPDTIGQAVSSGCIRMLNDDVEHLFENVKRGTKVVVI